MRTNTYILNNVENGFALKEGMLIGGNWPTGLVLRNPTLKFLNFLSSRALLSYKPLSYKENVCFD